MRRSLATLAVTASLALAAAPLAVVGAPTAQAASPAPPGFTTVWSEDFSGAAGTGAPSAWTYDTGPGQSFGTGEIETMTSSTANVYQDGQGHLVLKALHAGSDPGSGWTSGRIQSQGTWGAAPGGVVRMESVLKLPDVTTANGAGYWPAFWMLGEPLRSGGTWPGVGEIDVMEAVNGRGTVFATLHCGVNPGGPCDESTGIGSGERPCAGCGTAFHSYAVEIDRSTAPEQIRWYLDGENFFTVRADRVDPTTWAKAVDHPFFMIYDLAIGGGLPNAFGGGPSAATVSGASLVVDSVTVSTRGPATGGAPAPAPVPNPAPAPAPPAPAPGASGPATQLNGPGGKCVDVAGDDTGARGAPVQLWTCQGAGLSKDQQWTWSGSTLRTLGRCLDVTGGSTAAGARLQLWDCNGGGAQDWRQVGTTLVNPASGRCADAPSGRSDNGTRLQVWDCNGSSAQRFVKAA